MSEYQRYWFKCNHCDHRDCIEHESHSFIGAGIQCEEFFQHLSEAHGIEDMVSSMSKIMLEDHFSPIESV
jgi:hypothetical protein